MERTTKVNIFLAILAAIAIFIAIFAVTSRSDNNTLNNVNKDNIRALNDTIKVLKEDIVRYQTEIEKLEIEKSKIREEIIEILKDNETIDSELANGDWDVNIRFLSEFLSKEDSLGK